MLGSLYGTSAFPESAYGWYASGVRGVYTASGNTWTVPNGSHYIVRLTSAKTIQLKTTGDGATGSNPLIKWTCE